MLFYKIVGQNIRKYRQLRGYSLQDIAEEIGVIAKTVQRYEMGEIRMDVPRLGDIAKSLGVKTSDLVAGT
ncbi:MAG: helix-turn-helix transcriptional regulator, partial [Firmicutes bacterium]|nr:helix-turn-helix transcriptional regulator [Bacillota bacterium]